MPNHDPHPVRALLSEEFPPLLSEIPDAPKKLFARGTVRFQDLVPLAVVGSRKHTAYGRQAAESLVRGLAGAPILIISGLALGIDSLAHAAALDAGLPTLAVPGSGLGWDVLYPASHRRLAERILAAGGGLLSEYEPDFAATPWSFPKRNRIMAGLSKAVLIIEATERSGSLVTARLAMEYNRDVLAVPGPIASVASAGTNGLIKDGAALIRSSDDVLDALGIPRREESVRALPELSPSAARIYDALVEPADRETLFTRAAMNAQEGNVALLELEMKGLVTMDGGLVSRA